MERVIGITGISGAAYNAQFQFTLQSNSNIFTTQKNIEPREAYLDYAIQFL